jgi:hypothetical protein
MTEPQEAPPKRCKECRGAIPRDATRCQHCGVAQNRGFGLGQVVGAIFILLIAGFLIVAFTPWLR